MLEFSTHSLNDNLNNLVIFIGVTGAGKTTVINNLNGTQYDMIDGGDLILKEGYWNQLKVGRNKSETLYCESLKIHTPSNKVELNFLDTPGFFDTHFNNKSIISSLGVPLAITKSNSIKAIVIVLDYDDFDITKNSRGERFQKIAITLSQLFKDFENLKNNVKLNFAITRPDLKTNKEFKPEKFLTLILDNLKKYENERRVGYDNEKQNLNNSIKENEIYIGIYEHYLQDLKKIKEPSNLNRILNFLNQIHDTLKNKSSVKSIDFHNIENIPNDSKINELIQKLNNDLQDCVELNISKLNDKTKESWESKLKEIKKANEDQKQKFMNINGLFSMIELILKNANLNNTFFFRCDEQDDKNKFFNNLEQLVIKNEKIEKNIFNFKINAQVFETVLKWCSDKIPRITSDFENFYKEYEEILNLDKDIQDLQKEILTKENDLDYNIKPIENTTLTENDYNLVTQAYFKYEVIENTKKCINDEITEKRDMMTRIKSDNSLLEMVNIK